MLVRGGNTPPPSPTAYNTLFATPSALRAQKETYLHTITQAWSAPATEHGAAPAVFLLQCRRRAVAWWSPSSENPGASEQQDFFCGQRRGAGEYEIGNISYYEIVHPWYNILAGAKNPVSFFADPPPATGAGSKRDLCEGGGSPFSL